MIKAILACDDVGGVSKNGTIPWPHNTTDLQWFKNNTEGHVVVMGSTTWKDPHVPRPLPNRINVLVTSNQKDHRGAHFYVNGDLAENIKNIETMSGRLITWIIGGPNIIKQTLGIIDEFYLSRIPGEYNCDTFLPLEDIENQFSLNWQEAHPEVVFQIWKRVKQ